MRRSASTKIRTKNETNHIPISVVCQLYRPEKRHRDDQQERSRLASSRRNGRSFRAQYLFGFPVIEAVSKVCTKPLDVHFMIVHPEQYIEQTAKAGAMMMNVHYEACTHLHRTIQQIHAAGMKAGVTLNPSTPVCVLEDIICDVDMVLLMSVNPGFGGQQFIENTIGKLARLRQLIKSSGSKALIEIDGGVQAETAPRLIEAGADILVSGSYVFKSKDPLATIHGLKTL